MESSRKLLVNLTPHFPVKESFEIVTLFFPTLQLNFINFPLLYFDLFFILVNSKRMMTSVSGANGYLMKPQR